MLDWLWGFKTTAMFDVWSIEHVLSGLSVGHAVKKRNQNWFSRIFVRKEHNTLRKIDLLGVLLLAYAWETIEHYLETGSAGPGVEYWFQGVEAFSNRFIADPLMMVLGYYLAVKYPVLVIPARILSVAWLVVHIFVFPHSMYLHTLMTT